MAEVTATGTKPNPKDKSTGKPKAKDPAASFASPTPKPADTKSKGNPAVTTATPGKPAPPPKPSPVPTTTTVKKTEFKKDGTRVETVTTTTTGVPPAPSPSPKPPTTPVATTPTTPPATGGAPTGSNPFAIPGLPAGLQQYMQIGSDVYTQNAPAPGSVGSSGAGSSSGAPKPVVKEEVLKDGTKIIRSNSKSPDPKALNEPIMASKEIIRKDGSKTLVESIEETNADNKRVITTKTTNTKANGESTTTSSVAFKKETAAETKARTAAPAATYTATGTATGATYKVGSPGSPVPSLLDKDGKPIIGGGTGGSSMNDLIGTLNEATTSALEEMKNPNGGGSDAEKYKIKQNGQCDFGFTADRAKKTGFTENYKSETTDEKAGHKQVIRTAEDKSGNKYKEVLRFDDTGKMIECYRSVQAKDKDGNYKLKGEFMYTSSDQKDGAGKGALTETTGVFAPGGSLNPDALKDPKGTADTDKGKHLGIVNAEPVTSIVQARSNEGYKIFLNNPSDKVNKNPQSYGEDAPVNPVGSGGAKDKAPAVVTQPVSEPVTDSPPADDPPPAEDKDKDDGGNWGMS